MKNLQEDQFSNSKYIKPKRYTYIGKDNKKYTWDFIEALDSVSVFYIILKKILLFL